MKSLPTLAKQTMRSRWFILGVHAGLWILLYLALRTLGGKTPPYGEANGLSGPAQSPPPIASLDRLYHPELLASTNSVTNLLNPFFTGYFVPPVAPPPTTRKLNVTYQGFYETAAGPRRVILKVDADFLVAPLGTRIATNLFIADATMQALTLTNLAAQTNIVPLNVTKECIVPIQ